MILQMTELRQRKAKSKTWQEEHNNSKTTNTSNTSKAVADLVHCKEMKDNSQARVRVTRLRVSARLRREVRHRALQPTWLRSMAIETTSR